MPTPKDNQGASQLLSTLGRERAERFVRLLEEASDARMRGHARSSADEQLAELVATREGLSNIRNRAEIDPEFRMALRAMLVATAEREGIGIGIGKSRSEESAAEGRIKNKGRHGKVRSFFARVVADLGLRPPSRSESKDRAICDIHDEVRRFERETTEFRRGLAAAVRAETYKPGERQ